MRPPAPVPVISRASMPLSASSLRTTGESRLDVPPLASGPRSPGEDAARVGALAGSGDEGGGAGLGAGAGGGGGGGGASAGGGAGSGSRAAGGAGAGAVPASEPAPTTASLVPTSTVSPSWTRISESTPSAGEGTSESTLSVDTSNSGSSCATWSPTFFSQRMIVPSVTVSPSCGIVMSANVQTPSGECDDGLAERLGERRVGLDERGDLVRRRLPVHREVRLAELLGHPGADHVDPEQPARPAIGSLLADHLDEPLGLPEDA